MLHDDALLAIFDFYVEDPKNFEGRVPERLEIEVWQLLVHGVGDGEVLSLGHHAA